MGTKKITLEVFQGAVKGYIGQFSSSQSKLAKKAGIDASTMSRLMKGEYGGQADENMAKVMDVIERDKARVQTRIKKVPFVENVVFDRISTALNVAWEDGKIVVITAESGVGKTTSIKEYADREHNVVVIEADNTFTMLNLLEVLAKKVEAKGTRTREKAKIAEAIIEKLKDSDVLLIIDEAEYLSDEALDILRRIHDKAGIAVALVGMPRLLNNVIGGKEAHKQIYTRMNHERLDEIGRDDIRLLMEQVFDKIPEDVVDLFERVSKGITRVAVDLLRNVQRVMIKNELEEVTVKAVKTAMKNIIQVK